VEVSHVLATDLRRSETERQCTVYLAQ
jgi:hypothetical protein